MCASDVLGEDCIYGDDCEKGSGLICYSDKCTCPNGQHYQKMPEMPFIWLKSYCVGNDGRWMLRRMICDVVSYPLVEISYNIFQDYTK